MLTKNVHCTIIRSNATFFCQIVPQGSDGAQDAENRRIEAIANELRRRCELYEAQRRDSQPHVNHFKAEQRVAETFAKEHGLRLPMERVFDLGFNREEGTGRYSNAEYTVWDLIPRNVLRDRDGDIFVVDAEIKRN